ncbi:hypothetical protein KIPB_005522 [Kipferlia bialata]|uniref:Uncharacterized protein n=1 Tax=Kipferlia bialata TaxID=797122 RepID=A0A9K3GJ41_9EUKA|nr:hypothetical protein KIPB_005522 [Kipferlia bialata]|eukprot:g5522.t1
MQAWESVFLTVYISLVAVFMLGLMETMGLVHVVSRIFPKSGYEPSRNYRYALNEAARQVDPKHRTPVPMSGRGVGATH